MMICALLAAALAAAPISLEEVRQQSLGNTQALLAELDRARAMEQTRVARSAIYPRLWASAGAGGALYGPQRVFSTVPRGEEPGESGFVQRTVDVPPTSRASLDLNLTVSQLIYDGGRWWSQVAQAGALEEAEAGQLAEQQLASELEAVRRFYELYRAQESRRLLEANVRRGEDQLERARALFEAGRGQRMDVLSAQVNLGNDRLEFLRSGPRLEEAQSRLAVWLSRPAVAPLQAVRPVELEAQPGPVVELSVALEEARAKRPLLRAISQRVRAAGLGEAVVRADTWPKVSAQVTGGRQGPSADPFFTQPSRQNYVQGGLNLRWDLFTGYQQSASQAQAGLTRRRAELELAQAERDLEAELRGAVAALVAQVDSLEIASTNLEVASQAQQLAEARFEAGAGSTLEVRDAQLKLAQSELAALQVRIDVEIARAALSRALGRGVTQ